MVTVLDFIICWIKLYVQCYLSPYVIIHLQYPQAIWQHLCFWYSSYCPSMHVNTLWQWQKCKELLQNCKLCLIWDTTHWYLYLGLHFHSLIHLFYLICFYCIYFIWCMLYMQGHTHKYIIMFIKMKHFCLYLPHLFLAILLSNAASWLFTQEI